MTLIILILILVAVIISSVRAARIFSSSTKKDREFSRARDDRITKRMTQVDHILKEVGMAQELIRDYQLVLNDNLKEQNTAITMHMIKLQALAVSDILVARQNELSRSRELKSVLERIISITTSSKQEIATSDMLALEAINNRIQELEAILTEG